MRLGSTGVQRIVIPSGKQSITIHVNSPFICVGKIPRFILKRMHIPHSIPEKIMGDLTESGSKREN